MRQHREMTFELQEPRLRGILGRIYDGGAFTSDTS